MTAIVACVYVFFGSLGGVFVASFVFAESPFRPKMRNVERNVPNVDIKNYRTKKNITIFPPFI